MLFVESTCVIANELNAIMLWSNVIYEQIERYVGWSIIAKTKSGELKVSHLF